MAKRSMQQSALSAAAQALMQAPETHTGTLAAPANEGNAVFKTANQKLAEAPDFKPADVLKIEQAQKVKPGRKPVIRSAADAINVHPIGPKIADAKKVHETAEYARGHAVAELVWKYVAESSKGWRQFQADLIALSTSKTAHQAFRAALNAQKIAANKTSREVTRSAFVRISEMMTFSRAVQAGFDKEKACDYWEEQHGVRPAWEGMSHAVIMAGARAFLKANATGDSSTAGRKKIPALDKIKTYILKTANVKQLKEVEKMVHALAARLHTPKQVERELEKREPVEVAKERRATIRQAA